MSRDLSIRGLAIATVLAGTMLALGGAFAFRPELVLEAVPELESALVALDPAVVVFVLAITLVLLAPLLGIIGRIRAPSPRPLRSDERSSSSATRPVDDGGTPAGDAVGSSVTNASVTGPRKSVGEPYERNVALATSYDERTQDDRDTAREQLVESMRPIAATAFATRTGRDHETAVEAIEAGTWTDDVRAAAFLADEDGQSIPISVWLFDLIRTSDPFVRTLKHTIEEIEGLWDGARRVRSDRKRSGREVSP